MRTYKYICKKCHSRQTNSPDQLCSIKTASPDGVCWRCRKKVPMEEFDENKLLKEAIARYKRDLMVLSHRQDGLSYGQIAKITGIPVSTCHSIVSRATRSLSISDESPAWAFDNKDKT